ncbi:putative pantothenate protein [Phaeoacremonium minimum UCRPA7]|uniref:Putative pantothenate protein n=1 Tax=Phaeoacremonium minimum (strain UCR-PA7) TaxID=1286976 RepID=R8BQB7_PHAM7|nr:putative pantothenate protein [Phaeoacremonium minimum UCRPA7]EOO01551.1 putative pantothenate protein [Phaeoacremonium minimum UCRPA7]
MSTNTASGAASPKDNGNIQVAVEAASAEEEHRRHLFGITLPRYFNRDADRTSYTALSCFMQTLDNTNISNAYVSGMKEDLSLFDNELNYFSTTFNCGIIAGAVPLILLATRIRPSILMPACELAWTALVMGIAGAKSAQAVYGLRFAIGFFQGIAFPGFAAVLGAWYTPSELGKRMALYEVSARVAGMFSGYIQAGLYTNMNGKGMASWRWLFIFDGLISIPISLWGFYALPDQPRDTKARWLKAPEVDLAIRRMDSVGRKPVQKITWTRFKGIWTTWHVYLFVACYFLYGAFSWGDGYFNLWLQYLGKYTVPQINNIPTAGQGAALVNAIISGFISDWLENRPIVIVANMMICLAGNVFVSVWKAPEWLKFIGYIFITAGLPAQSITIAWLNEVCQGNGTLRGLIVSLGNTAVYAINSWALVLLFPAVDAPHYKYGYQVCAGMIALAILTVGAILLMIRSDIHRGKARRNDQGLLEFTAWENLEGIEIPREPSISKV